MAHWLGGYYTMTEFLYGLPDEGSPETSAFCDAVVKAFSGELRDEYTVRIRGVDAKSGEGLPWGLTGVRFDNSELMLRFLRLNEKYQVKFLNQVCKKLGWHIPRNSSGDQERRDSIEIETLWGSKKTRLIVVHKISPEGMSKFADLKFSLV
jgi:hypothetical protein